MRVDTILPQYNIQFVVLSGTGWNDRGILNFCLELKLTILSHRFSPPVLRTTIQTQL